LVGEVQTDLVALIGYALKRHGVQVAAQFWLQSLASSQKRVVIVTPLVDLCGVREAYSRILTDLGTEAFVTQKLLQSDLLVILGEREAKPALEASRSGMVNLARLGPYEDVEVYFIPDASEIPKSGFLHLTPVDSRDSKSYVVTFGAFGHGGAMKPRTLPKSDLEVFLSSIPANESQRTEVVETLRNNRSVSIILNGIKLATLYDLGLV